MSVFATILGEGDLLALAPFDNETPSKPVPRSWILYELGIVDPEEDEYMPVCWVSFGVDPGGNEEFQILAPYCDEINHEDGTVEYVRYELKTTDEDRGLLIDLVKQHFSDGWIGWDEAHRLLDESGLPPTWLDLLCERIFAGYVGMPGVYGDNPDGVYQLALTDSREVQLALVVARWYVGRLEKALVSTV